MRGFRVHGAVAGDVLGSVGALPSRRECLNCGWRGYAFLPIYYVDGFRAETFCPRCRVMDRYRSLVYYLRHAAEGKALAGRRPAILDIAPTEYSRAMLTRELGSGEYVSFDLENQWAEVKGDLQEMEFANASFDFVLCYEVLDYIPDDARALRELHRVLRPRGEILLRVSWDPDKAQTVEFGAPHPEDSYHIRAYGADLPERLSRAGFAVTEFSPVEEASEDEKTRFGLEGNRVFRLVKN